MKKFLAILASLVVVNVYGATTVPSGEIVFVTSNGGGSNPVLDVGGLTRVGTGFYGQLYVGLDGNNLQKVGTAIEFNTGGAALGFIAAPTTVAWNTPLGGTTMPVGGQGGVYVLRAWSGVGGSTFETASVTVGAKVGSTSPFAITEFGGVKADLSVSSAFPFANQHGSLILSTVAVPEPTTVALGLFGAAGLLFRRRK